MTQLTRDIHLSDLTRSARAVQLKIPNVPADASHLDALQALAQHILQPLNDHFKTRLFISSGYRSPALNAATPGSSKTSQHMRGEAADLDQDSQGNGVTNRQVFEYIRDHLPFDQLIWEHGTDENPAWVHVSFTRERINRGEVLRATMSVDAKTKKEKVRYAPMSVA